MQSLWLFIRQVASHWWAFMANVASVILWLAEMYLGWKVPSLVYWFILVISVLVASFLAWKSEYDKRKLTEAVGLDKTPDAVSWHSLADRFKQIEPVVRADWHQEDETETWSITGGEYAKDCTSLCELAGTMLLRSGNVAATLSEKISSTPDPIERWLEFLKEREGLSRILEGTTTRKGGDVGIFLAGSIDNLPSVSSRACVHCAASEIHIERPKRPK